MVPRKWEKANHILPNGLKTAGNVMVKNQDRHTAQDKPAWPSQVFYDQQNEDYCKPCILCFIYIYFG